MRFDSRDIIIIAIGGSLLFALSLLGLFWSGGYALAGLDTGQNPSLLARVALAVARIVAFPSLDLLRAFSFRGGAAAQILLHYLNALGWAALAYLAVRWVRRRSRTVRDSGFGA